MIDSSNTFLKSSMTYGAYLGFALVGFNFLTYSLGTSPDSSLNLLSYLISIGLIVYGQKFRRSELGGFISYKQALGFGLMMSVFAGIIFGFYQYILNTLIDPELIEKQLRFTEEMYLKYGYSEEDVEKLTNLSRRMNTPVGISLSVTFGYALIGLILSLITSVFTRRIDDSFSAETDQI